MKRDKKQTQNFTERKEICFETVIPELSKKLIVMPTNELDGQKRNKRAPLV